jgi:hopene-associated glycosyltransferase HpnB
MAQLRCETFWERLLVPPFIFFFKLLYPFAAVNTPGRRTAAAAGGCILVHTAALRATGGFSAMRDALIDDCTLAGRIKRDGHAIWLGLSHDVVSVRSYPTLAGFRRMVTRTAFTQLRYSYLLLLLVCLIMLVMFAVPWLAVLLPHNVTVFAVGLAALLAMAAAYWPTVRFYGLPALWALTLPLAGGLFLAMTIESAINYSRGVRAEWKGRRYASR